MTIRPRTSLAAIWAAVLLVALLPAGAPPTARAAGATLDPVLRGFTTPVFLTHAGDGQNRLYVVEQAGKIKVVENGQVRSTPFLDITSSVKAGGERGLLGLAFHPNFATNRLFYVFYTAPSDSVDSINTVARFRATDGLRADPSSRAILFELPDRAANHNAGMLAFGPDDKLYVATGDEGGANDTFGNGQNLQSLYAKILRLDVDAGQPYSIPSDNPFAGRADVRGETWAYGLRNPYRFSFDRGTGHLYIGDVGQGAYEEVDRLKAGKKGKNFGWPRTEGAHCRDGQACDQTGLKPPIFEYGRELGRSITGGYVYRGPAAPSLVGAYVYGDFVTGRIWALRKSGPTVTNDELLDSALSISSFGEDQAGNLYVVDYSGTIYRLTAP